MTPPPPIPPHLTLRARVTGLAATLALLAILAGLPAVLLAVGGLPDRLPSLDQLASSLTRPDDGTLAVTAFVILGWLTWAVLAASVLAEVAASLRGCTVRTVPGLALPQGAARVLVATAALLFMSAPATTPAAAATHSTPTHTATALQQNSAHGNNTGTATPADTAATAPGEPSTVASLWTATQPVALPSTDPDAVADTRGDSLRTHVVQPGDSLWSIAAQHLGSGRRYPEIAALNRDTLGARPDFLTPGTALRLPTATTLARTAVSADTTGRLHVVQTGDTLSQLALDHLGDPNRYPEIFVASRDTIQPSGTRLTDPDVIDIGWTLTIPTVTPTRPGDPTDTPPDSSPDGRDRHASYGDGDATASPGATAPAATPRQHGGTTTTPGADAGQAGAAVAPSPSAPATPDPALSATPSSVPATAVTERDATQKTVDVVAITDDGAVTPAWLLTGLAGAGGILAGSLLLALRSRRRAQLRHRRPGRTIAIPTAELTPVEKTITVVGDPATVRVEWLDEILRRLAATQTTAGQPMPQVVAIEVSDLELSLHLSRGQDPPGPWAATGGPRRWCLPRSTDPDRVGPQTPDQPAPFPLLVTVGSADTGATWLLNCELLTPLSITGDPTYGQDLARYLAAELACNPWSHGVTVHCVGVAEELVDLNPERVRSHTSVLHVAAEALTDATRTLERAELASADVATARAAQTGEEHWHATLLLLAGAAGEAPVQQLTTLIGTNPGMTATAIILTNDGTASAAGVEVHVTADGRLTIPQAGLDLVAVGLTPDEAKGCAALLAQADVTADTPIPADPDADGWRALTNEAGALRGEHTQPRHAPETATLGADGQEERPTSILDLRDQNYVDVAATTAEDLETLAPAVTPAIRSLVEDTDPDLDADLETWASDSCDLPRLTLLGPVRARTRGIALTKRKPYYTELLAYLATRPYGATPDELAEAFSLTPARTRNDVKIVRDWLGINPRTGRKHLPDAREAPAAKDRGVGVYQVENVLTDIDLFRRLRARGEARGADGITDLRRALILVEGRPFDRLRPGGWSWLLEGDRLDHHMLCAVVDVAHLVTTHSLTAGDHGAARTAAELACLAAPYEEIPRLDLAAVAAAEGHHDEAHRIATEDIAARTDEPGAPDELPDRTARILEQHSWLKAKRAAS